MNRDQFISSRQADWRRFETLIGMTETQRDSKLAGEEISELSALYRAICFDLSLVQSRDWGTSMSRYLNGLVARGHNSLYRSQPGSVRKVWEFLMHEFPSLLRENHWYFWLAFVLSVVPGVVCGVVVAHDPSQAGRILPENTQSMMEMMYSAEREERETGMESAMAGFYVRNNVGIAFKCFALGAFAGIGTMSVLVFNSIYIGTITGFLVGRGHSGNFFEFVIGHGSFELTAIVVSGCAGLMIGHAIVHPGQRTITENLKIRGLDAVKIALGAGFMLVVAAFIEGFWSPSSAPREVKIVVGACLWVIVILYLTMGGRTLNRKRLTFNREAN